MTIQEANYWLQEFTIKNQELHTKEIILCPSFTTLATVKKYIAEHQLPIKLGAQNISPFGVGAYTGEVNAEQVKESAEYVIIGHSERRQHFGETDAMLAQKVAQAIAVGLEPIFCVQNAETAIPDGVRIVAYEPVSAIGSGNPDDPAHAAAVAGSIQQKRDKSIMVYGGSVNAENVASFTHVSGISGVLVGSASLDPQQFIQIINNA